MKSWLFAIIALMSLSTFAMNEDSSMYSEPTDDISLVNIGVGVSLRVLKDTYIDPNSRGTVINRKCTIGVKETKPFSRFLRAGTTLQMGTIKSTLLNPTIKAWVVTIEMNHPNLSILLCAHDGSFSLGDFREAIRDFAEIQLPNPVEL